MSAADALDDAVRAAAAELGEEAPVIGWALVLATLPEEETESRLSLLSAAGQQPYASAGLLHQALAHNLGSSE